MPLEIPYDPGYALCAELDVRADDLGWPVLTKLWLDDVSAAVFPELRSELREGRTPGYLDGQGPDAVLGEPLSARGRLHLGRVSGRNRRALRYWDAALSDRNLARALKKLEPPAQGMWSPVAAVTMQVERLGPSGRSPRYDGGDVSQWAQLKVLPVSLVPHMKLLTAKLQYDAFGPAGAPTDAEGRWVAAVKAAASTVDVTFGGIGTHDGELTRWESRRGSAPSEANAVVTSQWRLRAPWWVTVVGASVAGDGEVLAAAQASDAFQRVERLANGAWFCQATRHFADYTPEREEACADVLMPLLTAGPAS